MLTVLHLHLAFEEGVAGGQVVEVGESDAQIVDGQVPELATKLVPPELHIECVE